MGAVNLFEDFSEEQIAEMGTAGLIGHAMAEMEKRQAEMLEQFLAGNKGAASIRVAQANDATAEIAEKRAALNHFIRGVALGEDTYLREWSRANKGETLNFDAVLRDLGTASTSGAGYGGYTVATEIWNDIGVALEVESEFERRTFQYPSGGAANVDLPTLATRPSPTWRGRSGGTGEGGTITKSNPALGRKQLGAHDLSVYAAINNELIQDSETDIAGFVGMELARQIVQEKQYAWAVGDDDGMPNGIESVGYTAVSLASVGGTLNHTAVSRFMYSVPTPYHQNFIWVGSSTVLGKLVGLITTTGAPVYVDPMNGGLPRILGKPFVELPDVTATKLYGGDFSKGYVTRVRKQIEIRGNTDGDTPFLKNQTLIRGITRVDGEGFITDAVREFTGL